MGLLDFLIALSVLGLCFGWIFGAAPKRPVYEGPRCLACETPVSASTQLCFGCKDLAVGP